MKSGGRRQDHQHRLDDVDFRRSLRAPPMRASKGGIVQFTRAARPRGRRTTSRSTRVLPGWIDTDLTSARAARESRACTSACWRRTPAGALGRDRRSGGHRGVPRRARRRDFVTGTADPGRWRVFRHGMGHPAFRPKPASALPSTWLHSKRAPARAGALHSRSAPLDRCLATTGPAPPGL